MSSIDISVLIPVYGVEKYIEKALYSIFSQTKTSGVEYILVDDCSKDNSITIAKKIIDQYPDLQIKLIDHEVNGGLAVARQTAFDAAQGEYILCFDSDDWCESTMLEEMYQCATSNDADIVICDFYFSYSNREDVVSQSCPSSGIDCTKALMSDDLYGSLWSKLIKRTLFTTQHIHWVPGLNMWEDTLICAKVFCYAKQINYLPKPFVHYRQTQGSISDKYVDDRNVKGEIAVLNEIELFFCERGFREELESHLMIKKNRTKLNALQSSRGAFLKKYASLYPEAVPYIEDDPKLTNYYKIALKQINQGSFLFFLLLIKIKQLKAMVIRRPKDIRYT